VLAFGLDGDEVTPATFPLPTVQERLCRVAVDLHCGKGFALLRGFDMKRYSAEDALIIYLGVSSYIGDMVGLQDRKGNALSTNRLGIMTPRTRLKDCSTYHRLG